MSKRKTKPADTWPDDPVVDEVRRIRAALWKEAGGEINAYFDLVHREAQLARALGAAGATGAAGAPSKSRRTKAAPKRKTAARRGRAA
ncbi:MAG: hypothetical protein ACKVW3_03740 [Phycisphaerales bacterium]